MTTTRSQQNAQASADEIDFFELWGLLWAKKLLILGLMVFCGFGAFLFSTYKLGKPDQYIYRALVEIGRHLTLSGSIQTVESPHDLVLILNQQLDSVKASVPNGSTSLVSLESTHVDPETAKQQLDGALKIIFSRHSDLSGRLLKPLLNDSRLVAEPVMSIDSVKNKRMLITVASAVAGFLLGIFLVLMASLSGRRRIEKDIL
jgi:hypothetical protein